MILPINLAPRIIPDMGCNIKQIYLIYTNSIIINLETGKEVKQYDNGHGYLQCVLRTTIPNKPVTKKVHRLVLYTFNYIPGCENLQVNHINCNKYNNDLSNLEWCTNKENMRHAILNGISSTYFGETVPTASITEYQALAIGDMLLKNYPIELIMKIVPNSNREIIHCIAKGKSWRYLFTNKQIEIMNYNYLGRPITIEERHIICKFYQDNRYKDKYNKFGGSKKLAQDALSLIGKECTDKYFHNAMALLYRNNSPEITSLYNY